MWILAERTEKYGKWILGTILAVLLFLSVSRADQKSDFLDYYQASKRWTSGENLYRFDVALELNEKIKKIEDLFIPENFALLQALQTETGTYIYPPLFSFLLVPLSFLSPNQASVAFQIFSWSCLLGILCIFLNSKEPFLAKLKYPYFTLSLLLLLNIRFIESHIQNNQVGIFLILLVLASLVSKNDFLSGSLLALAVSIKVTPLVFLFVFLYEKRYRSILYFFIAIVIWNLLPSLYRNEYNLSMCKEWISEILGNAMSNPLLRSWKNNQSFISTLAKYFVVGADFINQPTYGLPLIQLSKETIKLIQLVFLALFGAPLLFLLRIKNIKWEIISLLFLVSVIFSGISWTHSFVVCLVPTLLFLIHWQTGNLNSKEIYSALTIVLVPLLTHRNIVGSKIDSALSMFSILLYTSIFFYIFLLNLTLKQHANRN